MLEVMVGLVFAFVAFYVTEKDNPNSELYKLLHKENKTT